MEHFYVKTIVCASGERLPTLIDKTNGVPVFDASLWVVSSLRAGNVASATLEQALRSVAILWLVLASRKIDLTNRLRNSQFLNLEDVEAIAEASALNFRSVAKSAEILKRTNFTRKKIRSMEQYRAKIKSRKPTDYVDSSTKAIRLSYIRQFLNWRINTEILRSNPSRRLELNAMKALVDDELRNRTPPVLNRDAINNRTGISRGAQRILLDTIDPANSRNPWLTNFTRYRNQLIIQILIATGIRRSEMLGIRISDIQPRQQEILIHRRPDDAYDPRINEPNTKTRARALPISPDLYSKIKNYLILRHNVVHGRHDFLITANNGNPISKSETNKIFRDLDFVSELTGLTPHVLRHTHCENLAEDLHKSGHSLTEIIVFLRRLGGWSDSSNTPHRYISRFINDAAATASLTLQTKLLIS